MLRFLINLPRFPSIYQFSTVRHRPKQFIPSATTFQSLISRPLYRPDQFETLLGLCLGMREAGHELSGQEHQKILISFSQFVRKAFVSPSIALKFIKYTQKYNLCTRLSAKELQQIAFRPKKRLFEDKELMPELLDFFGRSGLTREEMLQTLDCVVPLYHRDIPDVSDHALLVLFYHVVLWGWAYDKKPMVALNITNEDEDTDYNNNNDNDNTNNGGSRRNKGFITLLEDELLHRMSEMTTKQLVECSRIFPLSARPTRYSNPPLFKSLLQQILQRLGRMREQQVFEVVKNLRFVASFPEDFISEFETRLLLSPIHDYRNKNTLFLLFLFLHSQTKNPNSKLIQEILATIAKNSEKTKAERVEQWLEGAFKSRGGQSLLITELILLKAQEIEEKKNYFKDVSGLKEIKDMSGLLNVLSLGNMMGIRNPKLLDALYRLFIGFTETSELKRSLWEGVGLFFELEFYIGTQNSPKLVDLMLKTVEKSVESLPVYDFYRLIRVLAVYICLESEKQPFIRLISLVVERCLRQRAYFGFKERVSLLEHLSLSPETSASPLVEHLISFFGEKNNNLFKNERLLMQKNKQLSKILARVSAQRAILSPSMLEAPTNDLKNFKSDLKTPIIWLKMPPELNEYLIKAKQVPEKYKHPRLKGELVQYLGLLGVLAENRFKLEENIIEGGFEFNLMLKSRVEGTGDIYIDFLGENDYFVNENTMVLPFWASKARFMREMGLNYAVVTEKEWEKQEKKEVLIEKLSPFMA